MSSSSRVLALAISFIIAAALAVVFSRDLTTASYTHNDEYLSLERSAGFIKFNDWLHVYTQNEPSAMKPPLQYWLNAINVKLGVPEFLMFRLWSYLFLLGSIAATGLCAAYLCKDNLWVVPAAMLLVAGSRELVEAGRSAMLDSGHCFFLMASVSCFFYAKENSWWWLACGAMVGLGALQKSPIAFLCIAIMLYAFNKRGDSYYRWQNLRQIRQFNVANYLALLLLVSWPLLQTVLDGSEYLKIGVQEQLLTRFSPIGKDRFVRGDFFKWVDWLWDDVHITGAAGLLCMGLMLTFKKWRNDACVFALMSVALVVMAGFSLAVGKTFPRYLVVLTPLLVVILVRFFNDVLPWKPAILVLAAIVTVISMPRMQAAIDSSRNEMALDKFKKVRERIELFDHVRESGDALFIEGTALPRGAYGYFSKSTKPFIWENWTKSSKSKLGLSIVDKPGRELLSVDGPVLGITSLENIELVGAMVETYHVVYRDAEIVIWRRPARR